MGQSGVCRRCADYHTEIKKEAFIEKRKQQARPDWISHNGILVYIHTRDTLAMLAQPGCRCLKGAVYAITSSEPFLSIDDRSCGRADGGVSVSKRQRLT